MKICFEKANFMMVINGMKKQTKIEICLFALNRMQVLWLVKEAHANRQRWAVARYCSSGATATATF